ncbi:hypothetical protein G5C51_22990 [Streptomyces sp. A7024]|uniref:Esterase n=1 Tax=Streptomyces coryli TaxID=1128680 RepID=A0A6G4U5U5_9ACTN|nr:PHB depolymerase family esterase [Streptomyces coryli]NGN66758.1 hypothetical protein [Streptomyces coryli]
MPLNVRITSCSALVVGLLLVSGCGQDSGKPPSHPSASSSPSASSAGNLRVDGVSRTYLLHEPAADADEAPRPLVIAFHGRGSSAQEMRKMTGLDQAADRRGTLVAYPEGLRHGWGAGSKATRQRPDPGADVAFTEALVKKLVRSRQADPRKVYVAGFSNGGSMALRVAAQRPGLVAGAAAVAGQLPAGSAEVKPTGPVPVLLIHGADDPARPMAGLPRPGPAPAGQEPITPSLSTRASAEAFVAAGTGKAVEKAEPGYERTVWGKGQVELIVVRGAGHVWPGGDYAPPERFGKPSDALDATDTALDFFAGGAS